MSHFSTKPHGLVGGVALFVGDQFGFFSIFDVLEYNNLSGPRLILLLIFHIMLVPVQSSTVSVYPKNTDPAIS